MKKLFFVAFFLFVGLVSGFLVRKMNDAKGM